MRVTIEASNCPDGLLLSTKYFCSGGFLGTGPLFALGGKHMARLKGSKNKPKIKTPETKPRALFSFQGKRSTMMMLEVVPWARGQYTTN